MFADEQENGFAFGRGRASGCDSVVAAQPHRPDSPGPQPYDFAFDRSAHFLPSGFWDITGSEELGTRNEMPAVIAAPVRLDASGDPEKAGANGEEGDRFDGAAHTTSVARIVVWTDAPSLSQDGVCPRSSKSRCFGKRPPR